MLKVDADEEGVGGDDAADCLRYLVATKTRTITVRKLRGVWAAVDGSGDWLGGMVSIAIICHPIIEVLLACFELPGFGKHFRVCR